MQKFLTFFISQQLSMIVHLKTMIRCLIKCQPIFLSNFLSSPNSLRIFAAVESNKFDLLKVAGAAARFLATSTSVWNVLSQFLFSSIENKNSGIFFGTLVSIGRLEQLKGNFKRDVFYVLNLIYHCKKRTGNFYCRNQSF